MGRTGRTMARRARRGRRMASLLVTFALLATAVVLLAPLLDGTLQRLALPLSDASLIRAQASEKHLDPALIAAVIYAETKFQPRTSPTGALGLMQIEPETAAFIAHKSGGTEFTTSDLASPSVNLAYGSWYLRYLLDHYDRQELPAVAAYNAGLTAVDAWVARAAEEGRALEAQAIPYPETRAYVERVLAAQSDYRATYPRELGLG
ncbi:MAG: lytic transglycosylase domain-containing protein [Acidobacteriota bacterium]|nr:lytic transglycosylase domain-containing protein [Acidobacteriota bacterium]